MCIRGRNVVYKRRHYLHNLQHKLNTEHEMVTGVYTSDIYIYEQIDGEKVERKGKKGGADIGI